MQLYIFLIFFFINKYDILVDVDDGVNWTFNLIYKSTLLNIFTLIQYYNNDITKLSSKANKEMICTTINTFNF